MSRLHRKFMTSIAIVLLFVIGFSLFLNNKFINRFYLYQKKQAIHQIGLQLKSDFENQETVIKVAEKEQGMIVVIVDNINDNEKLNQTLKDAFLGKGFNFEKYWFWDQDYERTIEQGYQLRNYRQPYLNYNLLVGYVDLDEKLAGVAMIIPDLDEAITLINYLTTGIFLAATLVILLILFFLIRRILMPLQRLNQLTEEIGNQHFQQITMNTNDELQDLADNINGMSAKLESAYLELQNRGKQMEDLLHNVSHDLKTPISLVKAYGAGILDGMDDGTFLNIILKQADKMDEMVARLLSMSMIRHQSYTKEQIDFIAYVKQHLSYQDVVLIQKGICVETDLLEVANIFANRDLIDTILSNLLSNAIKYTEDGNIYISLQQQEKGYLFSIANGFFSTEELDVERIWEPFYVGEPSRNKQFSGNGLGLPLVYAACQALESHCTCRIKNQRIEFTVLFPNLL